MLLRLACERGLLADDHSIAFAVGQCCFAVCLGKAECESSVCLKGFTASAQRREIHVNKLCVCVSTLAEASPNVF